MTQILQHIPRDQIPKIVLQNQELNSHFDLENNSDWDNNTWQAITSKHGLKFD